MAERRMISLKVIDTDNFLDMPLSTRYLYHELNARADDDGFIGSPKKIAKMVGGSDDDLKLLAAKQFVIPFLSGVIVIKHWRVNNYIRPDRYNPTVYQEEKQALVTDESGAYCLACIRDGIPDGIPDDNQTVGNMDTQVRLGKVRLGKVNKEITGEKSPCPYSQILDFYSEICKSFPKLTKLSDARKKAIKARLNSGYTLDDFKRLFEAAEASDFLRGKNNRNWAATFDWLIKDANMAKVLDGNYANKAGPGTEPPVQPPSKKTFAEIIAERTGQ